jgi:hypothetical protein
MYKCKHLKHENIYSKTCENANILNIMFFRRSDHPNERIGRLQKRRGRFEEKRFQQFSGKTALLNNETNSTLPKLSREVRDRETERQRDRETETQRDRRNPETERWRDRKTERHTDRDKERWKAEIHPDRETMRQGFNCLLNK